MVKRLLIIVPVVLVLILISLFLPARQVTIKGIGRLSFETAVTLSVGSEVAYASPDWLSGWSYRKELTIDQTKVDADLTDFPILVKLTSSNFDFSKARSDGYDIRFTSSNGTTLLKYERERHDSTNQVAEYWVKIPSVSGTVDTDFYIYYGKSDAADGADPTAVWDANYKMVQHLKDLTTSTTNDSTLNNNDGTKPFAPGDVAITSCDSLTDWTGTSLTLETVDKQEGTGAVKDSVATPVIGTTYTTSYNPAGSWNLGNRQIDFRLKSDRANTVFTSARLYIYDGAGNWRYHALTFSAATWKRFQLGITSGGTTSATPPDATQIDKVEWQFVAASTTAFYKLIDIVYAGGSPVEADGKIGKGQDFTPTTQYLQIGTTGFNASSGTVELWAKAEGFVLADPAQYLFGHTINPGWSSRIQLYTDDTLGNLNLGLGDSHSRALDIQALNTATWYHIVLTWNGTNYVVYVDSVSKATGTYAGLTSIESFADIGNAGQALERIEAWNGIIDEVRVSNSVRSAAWIKASYYSGNNTLTTFGGEETLSIDITATPPSKAFGIVSANSSYWSNVVGTPSSPLDDNHCFFTVTNNGNCTVNITIKASVFGGGVGWTLGTPAQNVARITAFKSGDSIPGGVVLTTGEQSFIPALADGSSKKWEIKLETPTSFTDGVQKSSTITLTATFA